MNMLWIRHYICAVFLLLPCVVQGQGYCEIYPAECRAALSFWMTHKSEFEAAAGKAGVPAVFLFAIVAPEISQYGSLTDKAQTYALKTLYVQKGKHFADFSIGRFQMKPSFVEQLEVYVLDADTMLAMFPEIIPEDRESRRARGERVRRLERLDWQLEYLALFCRVVQHRFGAVDFTSKQEKLRFYANAYNVGFMIDGQRLQQCKKACFPHFAARKFRYADVSLWFFENNL